MSKKLVILSDYGLDDACATVFLLEHRELFDGIDIVAIGGNTSAENSLNNAKKLLAEYASENNLKSLEGVRLIDSQKVAQPFCELPSVHGNDGMGDLIDKAGSLPVKLIQFDKWLDTIFAEQIILFSAGPCYITRLILAHIGAPEMCLMGGVIDETPNYNGYEFNQGLDAPSFNFCVKYPHVIATLDSCRKRRFNLARTVLTKDDLFSRLAQKAIDLAILRHKDNCYIYDLICAYYLVYPTMFKIVKRVDKWGNSLNNLEAKIGKKML